MKPEANVFIHRRDFRVHDNTALLSLVEKYPGVPVLHCFVFNPVQIDPAKNAFFNKNCVEFMVQSLKSLREQLYGHLYFFYGSDSSCISNIMKSCTINAVAWNSDYTPFARSRDSDLRGLLDSKGIEYIEGKDYTLFPMDYIKPYYVYTPFYKRCLKLAEHIRFPENAPRYKVFDKGVVGSIKDIDRFYGEPNLQLRSKGGRDAALQILKNVSRGAFKNYDHVRDYPEKDGTTHLSAYIKFGCVSVREVYDCFRRTYGLRHGLIRELLWREFYAHATWHNPRVLSGKPFKPVKMRWERRPAWHAAVMKGRTGFPLVDAAIRELLATGWMGNRVRMVVASFITKDLALDWRTYEKELFGRYLIDYDPCTNCHSWQSIASVGIDSAPYWRIMNPWRQLERFDHECIYVKKWVAELAAVDPKHIREWRLHAKEGIARYPAPIVDHEKQVKKYLGMWKGA